jgi:hypothetical protein
MEGVVSPDVEREGPLVLDALETDQLVSAKRPYGRRKLGPMTRALMWGLRFYVLLTLVVVVDQVVQAVTGR